VIADDDFIVVLGSSGYGGEQNGTAQGVRHYIHFIVFGIVTHVIHHSRDIVKRPFVNAARKKCIITTIMQV